MSSYDHRIQKIGFDHYRLSWVVDRKYTGIRLRFPRHTTRDTDRDGAERFSRKWECPMPPKDPSSG